MNARLRQLLIGITLAAITAGCTTLDPYTREEKTSNAAKGAAIGAAAGAALGYITGHDKDRRDRQKRVLIGAGLGALTGAAVGNYMDQQEAELRKRLEGSGVSVTRYGDDIILNMPGNVTFAFDRAELNSSFYEVLNSVALVLKKYNKTVVEVAGHTDSVGSEAYNQTLSEQRAQSVASYLKGQDIDPQRLIVIGYGETRPITGNETAEGRALNRRVELTLVPVTEG
jgi:outer membrane protein OmpA-like peptidoglycan-associated protein